MILKFCFSRVNEDGVLENLLHTILCKIIHTIPIKGVIEGDKKEVFLYVKGKEDEIEDFSNEFSKLLPVSLFYTFTKTQVAKSMPEQKKLPKCAISLPFTHTMLYDFLDKTSKDYLNLNLPQDVGEDLIIASSLTSKDVDKAIFHLQKGENVCVSTKEGIKNIGIVNENAREILQNNDFTIMPCDLSLVQKMLIANEKEITALASLEKPIIDLRVNLIYKNKNILPTSWVKLRLYDTLLLLLLCKRLYESGEEFIYLMDKKAPCKYLLTYTQNKSINGLHINILENGALTMLSDNEYTTKKTLPHFEQKAHERFTSILYEYNLFETKVINFFLSKTYDDKAMFYSEKLGLIELISIKIPKSIEEIIKLIQKDENGKKLIQNYKNTYNDTFQNALHVSIPKNAPNNFYTLLGIVGALFGYGNDLRTSANTFLLHAKNFSGPKGPRIDVKLVNNKFPDFINVEKFIQSGLSFRLAGVEDETLCYGYLESISFFVSDMADIISKEFDCNNVSLCGKLFEFKRLLEVSAKNTQPNHKVFINKAFSIE